MIVNLFEERVKRERPNTQDAWIRIGIKECFLRFRHQMHPKLIRPAAEGYVRGLFGDVWETASPEQKERWIAVAEQAYRELYA